MEIKREHPKRLFYIGLAASALVIILAGLLLTGYLLHIAPGMVSGMTAWIFILYSFLVISPILAGCVCIGLVNNKIRSVDGKGIPVGGIFMGMILIVIGVVMLSLGTDMIPAGWKQVFISWQMLLIVLGVISVCNLNILWGLALIFAGNFFMVPRVVQAFPGMLSADAGFISLYWPVLLIAAGLLVVMSVILKPWRYKGIRGHNGRACCQSKKYDVRNIDKREIRSGEVNYDLIFTGGEYVFLEPEFYGGDINVVFGGITLDLRRTSLPEGVTYLEINAVFGGVSIYIPESWSVEFKGSSVFGAFADKRIGIREIDDSRKLIINANCVFGGGELK